MEILTRCLGYASTNTYYLILDNKMLIIDPCLDPNQDATRLLEPIGNYNVVGVLCTHAHFDHISGVDVLCEKFGCSFYIYKESEAFLTDQYLNAATMIPEDVDVKTPAHFLELGANHVDDFLFDLILTPGHTSNSTSIMFENVCFTGDFIFNGSVGRMDLPTGSEKQMFNSIKEFVHYYGNHKLTLYPGHGFSTTLQYEIKTNPYFTMFKSND